MAQTDRLEPFAGLVESVDPAGQLKRNGDVFQRRHRRHQMEVLKHDADLITSEQGQGVFGQASQLLAID